MKIVIMIVALMISFAGIAQTPEEKLAQMGITLPPAPNPAANYVNAVRTGDLLFLAGKGPTTPDGKYITGKVGTDLTIEQGYEAAKTVAINQIAVLKHIVKVLGMVNTGPDFTDHSKVMNGYSDMMVAVFGEAGKHARASVGMCSLPFGIAVEVEMIVEVED